MKRIFPNDDGAAERLAWLRLARCKGVGALTFARLLERFGSAGRALDALPELRAHGTWSVGRPPETGTLEAELDGLARAGGGLGRKSTRLDSRHANISSAVFCLK